MNEVGGDIWEWHDKAWIVVPINQTVTANGLIMGDGLAREAKFKYSDIPKRWGAQSRRDIKGGYLIDPIHWLIGLKTKREYKHPTTISLLTDSLFALGQWLMNERIKVNVEKRKEKRNLLVMPRLGCGMNGLVWSEVRPVIEGWSMMIQWTGFKVTVVEMNSE